MCARGPKGEALGSGDGARAAFGGCPCTPSTGIGAIDGAAGAVAPSGHADGAAACAGEGCA